MGINITYLHGFYDKYVERIVQHMVRIPKAFAPLLLLHSFPIISVTCWQGRRTQGAFLGTGPSPEQLKLGEMVVTKGLLLPTTLPRGQGLTLVGKGERTRRQ